MPDLLSTLQANAPWAVFLNVMLNQGGLPLPALPTILMAAALSAQHPDHLAAVLAAGLGGAVIGDSLQYWCGRHSGFCGGSSYRDKCGHGDLFWRTGDDRLLRLPQ